MKVLLSLIVFSFVIVSHAEPLPNNTGDYVGYPALQKLIKRMVKKGFNRNKLQQTFSTIKRDNDILLKVRSPAETKPWDVYAAIFLTEERAYKGLLFWSRHERALQAATRQYGIPQEYITAIIGVETLYGEKSGTYSVLRSLTTLAMDYPKRSKFYTSELEHFLHLVREEGINNPINIKGSYAGAMGLGQFISSSYRNFGIDYNGDGHKDLWHPEDAIGSVAKYFFKHSWVRTHDVAVPARIIGQSYGKVVNTRAKKPKYSLQQLAQYGVTPLTKINSSRVGLLKLKGTKIDEFWITGDNFYVITRYNHSPKYAMVVHHLAQELRRRKQLKK